MRIVLVMSQEAEEENIEMICKRRGGTRILKKYFFLERTPRIIEKKQKKIFNLIKTQNLRDWKILNKRCFVSI